MKMKKWIWRAGEYKSRAPKLRTTHRDGCQLIKLTKKPIQFNLGQAKNYKASRASIASQICWCWWLQRRCRCDGRIPSTCAASVCMYVLHCIHRHRERETNHLARGNQNFSRFAINHMNEFFGTDSNFCAVLAWMNGFFVPFSLCECVCVYAAWMLYFSKERKRINERIGISCKHIYIFTF